MDNDTTAYLTDIKRYEGILAKDPQSFCFAPLSDVYRKTGRLDDALEIALKGCEMHPGYVGGYMALGRACFEKGLHLESRQALEKVIAAMPENLLAHKLLCEVCRILGDIDAAARSEAVVRALTGESEPETAAEPLPEMGTKVSSSPEEEGADIGWAGFAGGIETAYPLDEDEDDEIIDLIDIVWDEDEALTAELPSYDETDAVAAAAKANPLSTVTIAELYVSQGFAERALGIYEEILIADPHNADVQQRIDTLRQLVEEGKPAEEEAGFAQGDLQEEDTHAAEEDVSPVAWEAPSVVMAAIPAEEGVGAKENTAPDQASVLETLEGWLENIRRRR